MVITDGVHLVSTVSAGELHTFASSLGLRQSWFRAHPIHPHYSLTPRALSRSIAAGAKRVTPKELVELAWWSTQPVVAVDGAGSTEIESPTADDRAARTNE